jgi:hypothetical protein
MQPPNSSRRPKQLLPPPDLEWRLRTARDSKRFPTRVRTMKDVAGYLNLALISGCSSAQESADDRIGGDFQGVLTYFLLQELQGALGLTEALSACVANVGSAIRTGGYEQTPELHGLPALSTTTFVI